MQKNKHKKFLNFILNKLQYKGKADTGTLYVVVILISLIAFSYFLAGGSLPAMDSANTQSNPGKQEIIFNQVNDPGKKNLQLQTFTVKNTCESKVAVDFLIDVSGSMAFGNKQSQEKAALQAFTNRMVDESVIGIQTFSAGTSDVVPISFYKDVKNRVQSAISNLPAVGNTQTRDGLMLSETKLSEAITQKKFPEHKYSLVLLTDGIPETTPNETDCEATAIRQDGFKRCFARPQDPRVPTNVATEIKNLGVEIYSINITSTEKSDVELAPYLEALLKDVASPPLSEHYYTSLDGADLKAILDKVFKDICS